MGTFSKILFNVLRVGYIVAHPQIVQQLVDLRWQLEGGTSLVLQLWLAELLNTGAVDRHLRRMRVHHRKKRNLIADYLQQKFPDWRWQLPSGGLQFWIQLPPEQTAEQVIQHWLACGVRIFSGNEYCGNSLNLNNYQNYLVVGFGAVTEAQIHQAFLQLS